MPGSKPLVLAALGSLFLAAIVASNADAAWPHDPNIGNLPVCTATNDQYNQAVIPDGLGGTIIVWMDYRAVNYDIYAQRLNAAGVPQWTANGIAVCTDPSSQYSPRVISDGAGGAIIAWFDARGGSNDVFAQRVSAAGVPLWTANGVAVCGLPNDQSYPTISPDGGGGAIIAWYDYRSGTSYDIYAQRLNGAGAAQWTANGVLACNAVGDQINPVTCTDGAGGAIIAWHDYRSATNYDVYAQRLNGSGAAQWTANGIAVCNAANEQSNAVIASDGVGGAVIAWNDYRSGTSYDVYAQRVRTDGQVQWVSNGVAVATGAGTQYYTTIASDGAGGALLAWGDTRAGNYDAYTQHVNAGGSIAWSANGVPVCTAAGDQVYPLVVSDGVGGALIAWTDLRSPNYDIYAQRVDASGTPQWTSGGIPVSTASGAQQSVYCAGDGAGGLVAAWTDSRSSTNDIYAQRIDFYGYLGNPEPSIASVRDVPLDQGGHVKVSWNAGYIDAEPYDAVASYRLWRSIPPNMATSVQRIRIERDPDAAARTGAVLVTSANAVAYYWELVATQVASQLAGYSLDAGTAQDSVGAGNPRTAFMVEARAVSGNAHWYSAPDSGYSVDNLPPVIPAPFNGNYAGGVTHLHWNPNSDLDFANYRLYRGSSSGFVPGPSNLIGAPPDTGFADPGPAGSWYKLSALDAHGNESGFAVLGPNGTTDVDGGLPRELSFSAPQPNPAHDRAIARLSLPVATRVTVALFDMSGRRVRTFASGVVDAGERDLAIELRDDRGRPLGSGLYFLRVEAAGRALSRRLMVVR